MKLVVALDFTASNGEPSAPHSLHYGTADRPNEYTEAISAVAEILLKYHKAGQPVPVFGFGARPRAGEPVSHCFPLTSPSEPVEGVEGILEAYNRALRTVCFFGPTHFAPIIRKVHCSLLLNALLTLLAA